MNIPTYSLEEVKAILLCEEQSVVRYVESGQLAAVKLGRSWIFPKTAFDVSLNAFALRESERRIHEAESKLAQPMTMLRPEIAGGRRRVPPVLSFPASGLPGLQP